MKDDNSRIDVEELCCRSALQNVGMCWLCRTGRRESMIDGKPEVPVLAVSWDCFAPSCMASTPCQWREQHGEQSHICNRRTSVALTFGMGVGQLGLKGWEACPTKYSFLILGGGQVHTGWDRKPCQAASSRLLVPCPFIDTIQGGLRGEKPPTLRHAPL